MTPDAARYADDSLTWGVPSRRIAAFVVDWLLIAVLTMGVSIGFAGIHVMSLGLLHGPAHLFLIVGFLYEVGWIAGPGSATPGDRAMGLSVRHAETLARPTLAESAAFVGLLYITLAAGGIWLAVALFTQRRRAIHDMISGLVVVRAGALRWTGPWQN